MRKAATVLLSVLLFSTSLAGKVCFVQLATFSNREMADRYFEFVKRIPYRVLLARSGKWYVIRVGPFDDRTCRDIKRKLRNRFKDCLTIHRGRYTQKEIIKENSPVRHPEKTAKNRNALKGKPSVKNIKNSSNKLIGIYIEKAKVCMGKRDCQNAIKYLNLAISLGDRSAKTLTYLGYAYYHIGDYVKAIKTFRRAIEADRNYPESYEGIGLAYLKLNSPLAAQTALRKAYKLKPDEISYGINLAVALMSTGNYGESLKVMDELESKYPIVPEVHYNRAVILLKQGEKGEAVRELETFVELAKSPYYRPYVEKVLRVVKELKEGKDEG